MHLDLLGRKFLRSGFKKKKELSDLSQKHCGVLVFSGIKFSLAVGAWGILPA